jgi:XTP/dITP diphosphohydrolase
MEVVVATRNPGKLRELRDLLADAPVRLISAEDAGLPEVEETGATFEENATKKALEAVRATGKMALGEDSGLEVDALGGRPGVFSSRFAGTDATDEDRNRLLLEQLKDVPPERRHARYHAVAVLATPDGGVYVRHGMCEGVIAQEPAGEGGFGYDPIFFYPPYGRTLAQVSLEEKHRVSHRGQALAGILEVLRQKLG